MVPGDVSKGPWGIPAKKKFKLSGDLIIALYTIYTSTHYLRQVWVYSLTGLVEELPNMIEKRFTHGCGHYVNTDNEEASLCPNVNVIL